MTSMTVIGLQRPITVYRDEEADQFILIEGGHRLEAARRLGWTVIPAKIVDWEPDQRRMWEISERTYIGLNSRRWNAMSKSPSGSNSWKGGDKRTKS